MNNRGDHRHRQSRAATDAGPDARPGNGGNHLFVLVASDVEPPDPSRLASELVRAIGNAGAVSYCMVPADTLRLFGSNPATDAWSASALLASLEAARRLGSATPMTGPVATVAGGMGTEESLPTGVTPPGLRRRRHRRRGRRNPSLSNVAPPVASTPASACGAGVRPRATESGDGHRQVVSVCADGPSLARSGAWLAEGSVAAVGPSICVTIAVDKPALRHLACRRLGQAPDFHVRCGRLDEPAAPTLPVDAAPRHLVIIDEQHFDRVGAPAVRNLRSRQPSVRMLLVCDRVDDRSVDDVLAGGINGILPATGTAAAWRRAARAVSRGELWLPRAMLAQMVTLPEVGRGGSEGAGSGGGTLAPPECTLTPREAAVVAELRQGFSNKEIASRLGICEDTVKKHLQSVFSKLGVRRRTELLKWPAAGR